MKRISTYYSKGLFQVTFAVVVALLLSVAVVQGATTISTNIQTDGTLSVTGLSTFLGGATTTNLTLLNGEVISNATDGVIQMNGIASSTSITLLNGETITNATDGTIALTGAATISSTLSVTSLATLLGGATTTNLTLLNGEVISNATDGVIQLGGIASSTSITLLNGETITNAADGTIALTGALTVSGASTLTGTVTAEGLMKVAPAYGLDTSSAGVLNIGTTTATTINIGRSGQTQALLGNATVAGSLTVTGAFSPALASSTQISVTERFYAGGTATTTINSAGDLSVAGTLGVTGLTTLGQASSTRFSVHDTAYFGGTATTTINSAGNVSVAGTLGVTSATTLSSTLAVTNLATFGQASSTRFSVHDTAYFGGTATSSFTSAGVLSLQNGETISNATNGTIAISATNVTFDGTASTTNLKVGSDTVSTIAGMIFGYCTIATVTVNATSTAYQDCTGATGVTSSYRVFVQATSSLPAGLHIEAASSTATTGTINVRIVNATVGANQATGINSFNFWAVR